MVVAQVVTNTFEKYLALFGQLGEFVFVALLLYALGRFAIEPVVRWVFANKHYEPTLERAFQKVLRVATIVGAITIGAWTAGFAGFLGGSAIVFAAVTRSEYIQTVKSRCEAAGVDLSTTTQHDLSGEIAVHDPSSGTSV